jgi:hypothetical protein
MNPETERYLARVKLLMFSTPRKAKVGVIQELRSHIVDSAMAMGGPTWEQTPKNSKKVQRDIRL